MSEPAAVAPSLTVTMIRCSTLLLSCGSVRLLTDPWFAMHLRGLPCFRRPGLRPEELPALDGLLVSHLHPDHFDRAAVARMTPPPRSALFPPGALARLQVPVGADWRELPPWESTRIGPVGVTAVPGPHTLPGPEEINFVVDFPDFGAVFFGGDARLDADVLGRVKGLAPIRLALLPVGGTRIFGRRTVMGPGDAERAADLLGAERVVPIHEGGIWLSLPPASLHRGRARHLARAFARRGEADRVVVLREGESASFR
jgi:L-ascorbate metabolism protein UlaG (beta-lactamase superfamily)